MSDPEDIERAHEEHGGLSRRTMLRLGMLAISATQLPAGLAGAQAPKPGAHLIGKLEGAEVVTDAAQIPKSFKEAPELAELVKAGKLPPVEQRIGQDPLVVKPLREIGKYGGTWRRGFTGPFDTSNGRAPPRTTSSSTSTTPGEDRPEHRSRMGGQPRRQDDDALPAPGHEVERRAPFTADDFVFWFEDVYQNKELVPTPLTVMTINGKPITIKKVDAATAARHPDGVPGGGVRLTGDRARPRDRRRTASSRPSVGPGPTPASTRPSSGSAPCPPQDHYLDFVMDHVGRQSLKPVDGGWQWKFDRRIFDQFAGGMRSIALPYLAEVRCRLALLRSEHGLVTEDIGASMYERLGRVTPVIEIPEAGHHAMLDQPLLLLTALRTLLADWDHSEPLRRSDPGDR